MQRNFEARNDLNLQRNGNRNENEQNKICNEMGTATKTNKINFATKWEPQRKTMRPKEAGFRRKVFSKFKNTSA